MNNLPSGMTQLLQMKIAVIVKLWIAANPVSLNRLCLILIKSDTDIIVPFLILFI
jgi:hypothetical protein